MTYQELLAQHGLTENDLSTSLKKLVGDYKKIEKFIEKCNAILADDKLTVRKKKNAENDLIEANNNLEDGNKIIVQKIQTWLPNREKLALKGKALAASRKKQSDEPIVSTNEPPPEPAPVQKIEEPSTPDPTPNPAAADNANRPKKTPWGLYVGLAISFALAAIGIGFYNSQKDAA